MFPAPRGKPRSVEPHPEERGALFEGLIASILRACRDYFGLFDAFYYWASATAKNTEVDFILQRDDRYTAIEVKASPRILDSHLRGLRSCRDLKELGKRILVYLGERDMKTTEGIDIWPFTRFVNNLDAKHLWDQKYQLIHTNQDCRFTINTKTVLENLPSPLHRTIGNRCR